MTDPGSVVICLCLLLIYEIVTRRINHRHEHHHRLKLEAGRRLDYRLGNGFSEVMKQVKNRK